MGLAGFCYSQHLQYTASYRNYKYYKAVFLQHGKNTFYQELIRILRHPNPKALPASIEQGQLAHHETIITRGHIIELDARGEHLGTREAAHTWNEGPFAPDENASL
jgi:hypothetical protein